MNAVVYIINESVAAKRETPWLKQISPRSSGSGVAINKRDILTCKHVISNAKRITITIGTKRLQASIVAKNREFDLALLRVEEDLPEVMELDSLDFAELETPVTCYGYPRDSTNLCKSNGTINRVVCVTNGLMLQVDCTVDFGNSGGPAISAKTNKIVGLCTSSKMFKDIVHIIPAGIIRHFLKNPKFIAARLGVAFSSTYNPSIQKRYDVTSGALISYVDPRGPCEGILKRGDVILKIGGEVVANDGTVALEEKRSNERIAFNFVLVARGCNSEIELVVRRLLEGNEHTTLNVTVAANVGSKQLNDVQTTCKPCCAVVGGLVFAPKISSYTYGASGPRAMLQPLQHQHGEKEKRADGVDQLVVMSEIVPHAVNVGYALTDKTLQTLNNVVVKSLKHLKSLLAELRVSKPEYLEFVFKKDKMIVLDAKQAFEADEQLFKEYGYKDC